MRVEGKWEGLSLVLGRRRAGGQQIKTVSVHGWRGSLARRLCSGARGPSPARACVPRSQQAAACPRAVCDRVSGCVGHGARQSQGYQGAGLLQAGASMQHAGQLLPASKKRLCRTMPSAGDANEIARQPSSASMSMPICHVLCVQVFELCGFPHHKGGTERTWPDATSRADDGARRLWNATGSSSASHSPPESARRAPPGARAATLTRTQAARPWR